jgi:hypothetical protein
MSADREDVGYASVLVHKEGAVAQQVGCPMLRQTFCHLKNYRRADVISREEKIFPVGFCLANASHTLTEVLAESPEYPVTLQYPTAT